VDNIQKSRVDGDIDIKVRRETYQVDEERESSISPDNCRLASLFTLESETNTTDTYRAGLFTSTKQKGRRYLSLSFLLLCRKKKENKIKGRFVHTCQSSRSRRRSTGLGFDHGRLPWPRSRREITCMSNRKQSARLLPYVGNVRCYSPAPDRTRRPAQETN
jgi:hypothetical protein